MIKVTINELLNSTEVLQKLSKKDFKAKLAWQVARLLRNAEEEIKNFNETRMTLITKYGEKDENGELKTDDNGNCKIIPESISTFSAELEDLLKTEVEINANKIDIEQLENLDFTPSDMAALEPYIEMGE